MRLPIDPTKAPTASGSVTDYSELSVAPWYGLAMCDPHSYPQNPCKPDSDSNLGAINNPKDAGSAFMEMQFYPPGNTTLIDGASCSKTQWCAALNIDSLESKFNFVGLNPNCPEPVNYALIQTNGVPPGSPAPQNPDAATFLGNAKTLRMNPGDVVTVALTDPSSGFTVKLDDLTTHQTGFMQASAKNGFTNTNYKTCAGTPFTWHAEYSTAKIQNQTPWAALEGGVLMQQEIGHGEACSSLANKDPFSVTYGSGTYTDPGTFDNCVGGPEGPNAPGEGPCPNGVCTGSTTQGSGGPTACPTNDPATRALCEFSDAPCHAAGSRTATINGQPVTESQPVAGCYQTGEQNGDLDFDGNTYLPDWPDGSANHPTTMRYVGPFVSGGQAYPQVQFETDAPGSENLCDTSTGQDCTAPPIGSDFYPFWSLNYAQKVAGAPASANCVWNFGNDIAQLTNNDFAKDGQYGSPDIGRYGGTTISGLLTNPATLGGCGAPTASSPAGVAGHAEQGQTLTETHATWSNGSTDYSYQWQQCDSSGNNCAPISGANAQTYTPAAADVGRTLARRRRFQARAERPVGRPPGRRQS